MTKFYALFGAAAIGFMGFQDYRGTSMFGRRPEGEGLFQSGPRRGPDGRLIGGFHSYNHK